MITPPTLNDTLADLLAGAKALGKGYDDLAATHAVELMEHPDLAGGEFKAAATDIKANLSALYFGHQSLDETERAIRAMWDNLALPRERVTDWTAEPTPQPWLVQDWLPQGELVLFTGAGGAGKSTLALQLAIALCLRQRVWIPNRNPGAPYFLQEAEDGDWKCHYAGYEDNGNQMITRARRIVSDPDQLDALEGRLVFTRERGSLWNSQQFDEHGHPTGAMKELLGEAEDKDLLVIDPSAAAYAGDENARSQVRSFLNHLSVWAESSGTTILLVAHPAKEATSLFSGSTDWRNAPRAFWAISKEKVTDPEDKKVVVGEATKLTLEKSSYGRPHPGTPALYLVGPYPRWEGTDDPEVSARANRPTF